MIKANELRIGNWVFTKAKRGHQLPSNLYVKVVGVTNRGDIDITVNGYDYSDDIVAANIISPIPLTEEIILKCEFEAKYFGIKTYYNPLMELDHDFKLMGVDYGIRVEYLHQLQNLYFALVGKELKVKL